MNKNIHYAVVMSSVEYKSIIHSVLRQNDIMYQEAISNTTANDKDILTYIKQFASKMSDFDSIILDLGCSINTDEELIEAIETVRYIDDNIRIIVLQGSRQNGQAILHQCFLSGIYNLIGSDDYINVKASILKCITQGMSYKDALEYRDEHVQVKSKQIEYEPMANAKKSIVMLGMTARVGVTHCVLLTAYSLRKMGYLVSIFDCTGSSDYVSLMHSYGVSWVEDEEFFTLENIDIYIKPSMDNFKTDEMPYNFCIFDMGNYHRIQSLSENEKDICRNADEKMIVSSAKPWELGIFSITLSDMQQHNSAGNYIFLFNFVPPSMQHDVMEMMKTAGINEQRICFLDYMPDYFSESDQILHMLGAQPEKKKRKLFGRKGG